MISQQQQQIGIRPPPPEYKVSPSQGGPGPLNPHNSSGVPSALLNQRFASTMPQQQQQQRRVVQQPMPPSGMFCFNNEVAFVDIYCLTSDCLGTGKIKKAKEGNGKSCQLLCKNVIFLA